MRIRKLYRRTLIGILAVVLFLIGYYVYSGIDSQIPDSLRIFADKEQQLNFSIPVQGMLQTESVGTFSVNHKKIEDERIKLNFAKPLSIYSEKPGTYQVRLKIFGFLSYKNMKIDVVEQKYLYASGSSAGIEIKTDGILVLGTGVILGKDGGSYEPSLNILKSGDYIFKINGENVDCKKNLINMIEKCNGNDIQLEVKRNNEMIKLMVKPKMASDGFYKIGAWVRDDTQGIGTLTYVDESGEFGALGHGITDIDTGLLMKVREGGLYKADVMQINKGEKGTPGEVVGVIEKCGQKKQGTITKNRKQGIFGTINKNAFDYADCKKYPLGLKQDVKTGKATILCEVTDKVEEYDIRIKSIEFNTANYSKGMIIQITDKKLLSLTNGIVQGMSGSPIIQNGKIVGAVTHVFVQDSTRGYGIFVENMIKFS